MVIMMIIMMIIYDDDAGRCEDLANVIVLVIKISPYFLSASSSSP